MLGSDDSITSEIQNSGANRHNPVMPMGQKQALLYSEGNCQIDEYWNDLILIKARRSRNLDQICFRP